MERRGGAAAAQAARDFLPRAPHEARPFAQLRPAPARAVPGMTATRDGGERTRDHRHAPVQRRVLHLQPLRRQGRHASAGAKPRFERDLERPDGQMDECFEAACFRRARDRRGHVRTPEAVARLDRLAGDGDEQGVDLLVRVRAPARDAVPPRLGNAAGRRVDAEAHGRGAYRERAFEQKLAGRPVARDEAHRMRAGRNAQERGESAHHCGGTAAVGARDIGARHIDANGMPLAGHLELDLERVLAEREHPAGHGPGHADDVPRHAVVEGGAIR